MTIDLDNPPEAACPYVELYERVKRELDHANDNLRRMTEIAVSRASIATLTALRSRITRLTLVPGLPQEAWAELCRLDSDMAAMGVPTSVKRESV